ncbi:MAG: hypothetical protein ACK55Z_35855, partial [bacterium]
LLERRRNLERERQQSNNSLSEVLPGADGHHGHTRPRVAVAQLQRDRGKERDEQPVREGEAQHAGQERGCAEPHEDDDDRLPQAPAPAGTRLHSGVRARE